MKENRLISILLIITLLFSAAFAETWVCPGCGSEENTKNFCGDCGTARPVTWKCPECGEEGNTKAFCENCGVPKGGKTCKAGDIISFGHYNGEGIEWQVMEVKPDGSCVLLSVYGLDAMPYNEEMTDVTWEICSLRAWLNGEFRETAFTEEERGRIMLTDVVNSDNAEYESDGGNDTQDYVYLLSLDEISKYYGVDANNWGESGDLICIPTEYAVRNGACTFSAKDVEEAQPYYDYPLKEGAGWWWLRSPGFSSSSAAHVGCFGDADPNGSYVDYGDELVRPALVLCPS